MAGSPWKRVLIPLVIILFPVIFWLLLTRGTNHFKRLPVLGPVEITEKGDSLFHTIGSFSMTNQSGRTITHEDLEGKIYIANFFFATCKTVCPKMNEQVLKVQSKFKGVDEFKILTFTVDPEHDSVPVLADYAAKMYADSSQWWFLTGPKDSIYKLAREKFLVPAAEGKTANDFFHSQDLILVDKEHHIRGFYDGMDSLEVDTLIDEIKLLMYEQDVEKKLK